MRDEQDIRNAMEHHANTVMRVSSLYMRNQADRDDMFQETFIKYAQSSMQFESEEHKKAWLIRVATNACKDYLKRAERRNASLDDVAEYQQPAAPEADEGFAKVQSDELLAALYSLEPKYREALYLKYYEGFTAAQIGEIVGAPENTVYTNLARGRERLKEVLQRER